MSTDDINDCSNNNSNKFWYEQLKDLKCKNIDNISCAYLNINTVANKFERLVGMIDGNIDIFCIAETKLDSTYPTQQFKIPGFRDPYRLDGPKVKDPSGGLLVYVRNGIASKLLNNFKLANHMQILPIEINLKKSKWLLLPIYRPPSMDKNAFNENLGDLIEFYSKTYENYLILGDFNLETSDSSMISLMDSHDLFSLIREPTCFKSERGSCIDLILTNKKYSFKNSLTFETGESDFHKMIYTVFKTTFKKLPPKLIKYRCYKKFVKADFERELLENLNEVQNLDYSAFQEIFESILEKHAPTKCKLLRGNNKPFMNRDLRNAIATRSRLWNIYISTKSASDLLRYKKQRNFVKSLNFKTKRAYFRNLKPESLDMTKKFWKTFKVFFSDKMKSSDEIILVEKEQIISKDDETVTIFNDYFSTLVTKLKIKQCPDDQVPLIEGPIDHALRKYSNHPSILKIKSNYPL